MKNKISYNNKRFYRKTVVSQEEYDKIIDEGTIAWRILNDDEFEFVRLILKSAKNYAKESILNNTITDVSEEATVSDTVKRIFSRKKKEQVDELVGQYKLVNRFFDELQERVDTKDSLEKGLADDKIVIKNA